MSQRSARDDGALQPSVARGRAPGSGARQIVSKKPNEETSAESTSAGRQRELASVQKYFDRFAAAMTSGDIKAMTTLWGVPAFVVGMHEARVVQSESEVEQFFEGAKEQYNAQGIVETRAEITHLDWIAPDLVIATVRWPYLDKNDRVLGEESSSYTLFRGEGGGFKVRVITMRGATNDPASDDEATDGRDAPVVDSAIPTDNGTDGE